MPTPVLNQITQRVVKGDVNTADALAFAALSIVQVGLQPATIDYAATVDYKLTDGEIDWSPSGKEPQVGQSYFVTYTFQGVTSFKSFDQITAEMDVNMRALQPAASTQPGSVTRGLFIDLPANQTANLYAAIQRVSQIQSLKNLDKFEGTELDDFGFNYEVERGSSTISSGHLTLASASIATAPILIPRGSRGSTLSTTTQASVFFKTTADGTIFPGQNSVTVPIEAEIAGASGNVGSNSIVLMNTAILGISVVTNQNPTTGGRDQESDTDYALRIKASFLANDKVSFRGIRRLALGFDNVIDALVVGAGDPLLVRGGGVGGKVDLYIQAESGISRSVSEDATYGGVDIPLLNQPVLSISSVFNNTTLAAIPVGSYQLIKDVGDLADSTGAADAVRILAGATAGDILTITYVCNGVLIDIQEFFADDDENAVPGRDFLTRTATEVSIDAGVSIVLVPGTDFGGVEAAIIDAVAGYIDNLKMGSEIKYATVFDLVKETAGVDDVRPLELLARRGEATAATIRLGRNEFPSTGNMTVKLAN